MKIGKPQKVITLDALDCENANPQKSSEDVDELAFILEKTSFENVEFPEKVSKTIKSEVDNLSL